MIDPLMCIRKTGTGNGSRIFTHKYAESIVLQRLISIILWRYTMRKFIFVVFVLLFAVLPVMGQADQVRNLSDADLRTLYEIVKSEMSRRGLDAVEMTLSEGKYIIGKDIPAGTYTITCLSTKGEELSGVYDSLGSAYDSMSGGGQSEGIYLILAQLASRIEDVHFTVFAA